MDHWIAATVFAFSYGTLCFGLVEAAKDIVALLGDQ